MVFQARETREALTPSGIVERRCGPGIRSSRVSMAGQPDASLPRASVRVTIYVYMHLERRPDEHHCIRPG